MYLHLYNGEQFENLKSQSVISRNVPYRRETFKEKHTLIAFDTNFEMVDGNFLNQRSDIKNMNEISLAIDSLNMYADSVGRAMYSDAMKRLTGSLFFPKQTLQKWRKNILPLSIQTVF